MTKSIRTQAIVLRRTNYGEADRILQLLTPLGQRAALAKGVRREKSKLAGGIELFAISDIVITEGKGELGIVTSARLVTFFGHILEDYDRLQFGYEVIKQISKVSHATDEPEWFDISAEILAELDKKTVSLALIEAWFYVRYAELLGHGLNLRRDAAGMTLSADKRYMYDVSEQSLRESSAGEIGADHIKLLRLIAANKLSVLAQIGGTGTIINECLFVSRAHAALEL